MKKIFLDVNILLDLIFARQPFFTAAHQIFRLIEEGELTAYASSASMTTVFYLVQKEYDKKTARHETELLLKIIKWVEVNEAILISAHASDFNDFEDAVQYFSSLKIKNLHAIISRNKKDFKNSFIPVLAPDEFLLNFLSI